MGTGVSNNKINMAAAEPVSNFLKTCPNLPKIQPDFALPKSNTIKMKIKIKECDVNKFTKILYNLDKKYDNDVYDLKELNESNTDLFINGKKYKYKAYFTPEKEGVYEIQLNIKILMKNCCCLFYGLNNLESIDLSSFNTQNVTNMNRMFFKCSGLQSLDLSSFKTQNVTDMFGMFYYCSGLQNLDLSSFNTQNVTDMKCMFADCYSLQSINLSSFNTQKVKFMNSMFENCKSLQSLNLSSFNTQNVTKMDLMFYNCQSLQNLDLSKFDIKKVTKFNRMFANCSKLQSLDLSSFIFEKITEDMKTMFENTNLKNVALNIEQHNFINELIKNAKIIYV